ncbi:hypothetical protein HBI90_006620 [Parastagonospora nodorum]|nr:hypothetical protein HBI90_006620 [Parastagonospora nodorum]
MPAGAREGDDIKALRKESKEGKASSTCERMLCTELNAGDPAELGNVVGLSASGVGQ